MTPAERIEEAYTVSCVLWICYIFLYFFCRRTEKRRKKLTKTEHYFHVFCDKLKPLVLILAISASWFTPPGANLAALIVFGGGFILILLALGF